jgi:hypothetical protein
LLRLLRLNCKRRKAIGELAARWGERENCVTASADEMAASTADAQGQGITGAANFTL